ncbi:uncharacterized protein LOC112572506 [Pomacea canaliculata]|uniref:uncharacterized protein LOC112572506 n=1 Tax=Pomacea canaliculata TaxID=400727 RepID=UPI000D73EFC5|nr:uncharacterized protein LOC112572506 [Pomacea canaliculata]
MAQGPSSMAQGPSSMAQGPSSMAQGPTVNGDAFASNTGPQMNSLNSFGSGSSGQQISNFGSSQSGSQSFLLQQAGVRPQCNSTERQTLYRSCAMSFGMAHMQYFRLMASQRKCRPELFSCNRVDELVRCTNSQPIRVISNRCWMMIRNVLTSFLQQQNVPCSFEDIYNQCSTKSADILPLEQRPQTGRGIDNNPLPNIMPIVMRHVMPMVMMMSSGGGGMFGF